MEEADPRFEALLEHVRETRGFDFTGYKRASLKRRVDRRMAEVGIADSYEAYLDVLQADANEFTELFNGILINVTDFFRDSEAWEQLGAEILPQVQQAQPGGPIRVWSAACASGQEPFSIAMLLAELLGPEEFRERVKIYATDVDEEALAQARAGSYSERDLRNLSPERRDRWFEQSLDGRWTISKEIRRAVIFGRNDLVQDVPISRIDLLLCRNVLMYFNSETQAKILPRLHFALKPGGVLFIGKAEMLLTHGELFTAVDLKRRFFQRTFPPRAGGSRPLLTTQLPGPVRERDDRQALVSAVWASGPVAQIVLDPQGRVAMVNSRADHVFGVTSSDIGRPFQDLELSYRPAELRSAVERAHRERRSSWVRGVGWVRAGGERMHLDIQVLPVVEDTGAVLGTAISFTDVTRSHDLHEELLVANRDLETAYEELQSANEELETTNEELQSTVEELETTNEELQSTNEELETMNEELQAMNDELHSSSQEAGERSVEVDELNAFLTGILSRLESSVIVLASDWRVRIWNRPAEQLWGLRADEVVGEHLLSLDSGLPVEELTPLVRQALAADAAPEPALRELSAVNRRGRSVVLRAAVSPLAEGAGAMVVLDELSPDGRSSHDGLALQDGKASHDGQASRDGQALKG